LESLHSAPDIGVVITLTDWVVPAVIDAQAASGRTDKIVISFFINNLSDGNKKAPASFDGCKMLVVNGSDSHHIYGRGDSRFYPIRQNVQKQLALLLEKMMLRL